MSLKLMPAERYENRKMSRAKSDGAFAGGCPQSSDFELQKRTVRRGENPLGKSLVIDGFQNAEFRGYRIALVPLFH